MVQAASIGEVFTLSYDEAGEAYIGPFVSFIHRSPILQLLPLTDGLRTKGFSDAAGWNRKDNEGSVPAIVHLANCPPHKLVMCPTPEWLEI